MGCKWLFRIKYKHDGTIDKHKDRLVAKCYTQRPVADFHDTFSLVVKLAIVQLILFIVVQHKWHIYQLDINNPFPQGRLNEEVYMS